MLYIAPNPDVNSNIFIVRDTADDDFELSIPDREFWQGLKDCNIMPQNVMGIYRSGRQVWVTPVSGVELKAMEMLSNPHFYVVDKLGSTGAKPYRSYGLYNFSISNGDWSDAEKPVSVAKLLLDTCGDVWQASEAKSRIETTREYISICVADSDFQSVYLRYDISDYSRVQRAYMKYKMMNFSSKEMQSRMLTLDVD